jgi:molybdopterin converting factor small subunit
MQVKILLFGQLIDLVGTNHIVLENIEDTGQMVRKLHVLYPALAEVPYAIAVDMNFITQNTSLEHDSQIALLPPYSGG